MSTDLPDDSYPLACQLQILATSKGKGNRKKTTYSIVNSDIKDKIDATVNEELHGKKLKNWLTDQLYQQYDELASTVNYIIGFPYKKTIYMSFCSGDQIKPFLRLGVAKDEASNPSALQDASDDNSSQDASQTNTALNGTANQTSTLTQATGNTTTQSKNQEETQQKYVDLALQFSVTQKMAKKLLKQRRKGSLLPYPLCDEDSFEFLAKNTSWNRGVAFEKLVIQFFEHSPVDFTKDSTGFWQQGDFNIEFKDSKNWLNYQIKYTGASFSKQSTLKNVIDKKRNHTDDSGLTKDIASKNNMLDRTSNKAIKVSYNRSEAKEFLEKSLHEYQDKTIEKEITRNNKNPDQRRQAITHAKETNKRILKSDKQRSEADLPVLNSKSKMLNITYEVLQNDTTKLSDAVNEATQPDKKLSKKAAAQLRAKEAKNQKRVANVNKAMSDANYKRRITPVTKKVRASSSKKASPKKANSKRIKTKKS